MKSSAKKIELASVDDLFSTEEGRQDAKLEKIQEIPLSELHPFRNHPFKVKDDEAMMETADSIKQYGVLVPAIARPDPEGGYELVNPYNERKGMTMCTVKEIQEAIREDCKSQHDMESTDIDRVMQTLPFAQEEPFTEGRPQKPLFWFYARKFEKR